MGDDYRLIPSALRGRPNPATRTSLEIMVNKDFADAHQRANAELQVFLDFFEIADRRGLPLPGDSQRLRAALWTIRDAKYGPALEKDLIERVYGPYAPDEVRSLIALAQHYGIPTRLLDWTPRIYLASYFAAESAMKCRVQNPNNVIVVWAFYFPFLGRHNKIEANSDPFTIVTAPSASNPNLAAQQGLFTLPFSYCNPDFDEYRPLDEILEIEAQKINERGLDVRYSVDRLISQCSMQKITLIGTEAESLLCLLAKMDITQSSVYPGYASIGTELVMRTWWR